MNLWETFLSIIIIDRLTIFLGKGMPSFGFHFSICTFVSVFHCGCCWRWSLPFFYLQYGINIWIPQGTVLPPILFLSSMMFIPVLFPNSFKSRWFHCTIFSIRFFSHPSPHVLNPTRDGALARLTPWQLASYWDRNKNKWSLISNPKFHIIQFVLIFQVIIPSSRVTNNVIHKLSLGCYIIILPL